MGKYRFNYQEIFSGESKSIVAGNIKLLIILMTNEGLSETQATLIVKNSINQFLAHHKNLQNIDSDFQMIYNQ